MAHNKYIISGIHVDLWYLSSDPSAPSPILVLIQASSSSGCFSWHNKNGPSNAKLFTSIFVLRYLYLYYTAYQRGKFLLNYYICLTAKATTYSRLFCANWFFSLIIIYFFRKNLLRCLNMEIGPYWAHTGAGVGYEYFFSLKTKFLRSTLLRTIYGKLINEAHSQQRNLK